MNSEGKLPSKKNMSSISSPRALGCQPRHQPYFVCVDRRESENWGWKTIQFTNNTNSVCLKGVFGKSASDGKDRSISDKGKSAIVGAWELD